ncbi:MAG: Rpn family recombination-promoting nuclease/putative transposase [Peptococcaceae bacterium]|nr:Rpn family recombination-promoting nuclease/putative transposase [Peptococcaceae bacterium]
MSVNREYKDSVFIHYLSQSDDRLVEIYNAIAGTDYPLNTPIEKNTLTDILYKDRVNDLSFTLDGRTLVLFEHQSTINHNMALRLLLYVAKLYEKELRNNPKVSIYQRKRFPIPAPKFVVLYNGREPLPEHSTWKLSDSYMTEQENPALELNVEIYNINYSETSELLQKSAYLNEYSYFIYLVQQFVGNGRTLDEAIKLVSEQCIAEGVMADFLREHSMEVEEMLVTEWDWDECIKVERQEGYEDGFELGIMRGKAEGVEYGEKKKQEEMIRAFQDVLSPEVIAEKIHVPVQYVLDILKDDGAAMVCEPTQSYHNGKKE